MRCLSFSSHGPPLVFPHSGRLPCPKLCLSGLFPLWSRTRIDMAHSGTIIVPEWAISIRVRDQSGKSPDKHSFGQGNRPECGKTKGGPCEENERQRIHKGGRRESEH